MQSLTLISGIVLARATVRSWPNPGIACPTKSEPVHLTLSALVLEGVHIDPEDQRPVFLYPASQLAKLAMITALKWSLRPVSALKIAIRSE
jgi:hypothetical protein